MAYAAAEPASESSRPPHSCRRPGWRTVVRFLWTGSELSESETRPLLGWLDSLTSRRSTVIDLLSWQGASRVPLPLAGGLVREMQAAPSLVPFHGGRKAREADMAPGRACVRVSAR